MGQIQVLPANLANQIAAGEVVERPASCVKELVENSLDAGATSIFVRLVEGGIREITVQDNGRGMDAEDAVLAFARHATSKIRQARDLMRISTLGFRGEALASIAAVAKVTLQSRVPTAEQGVTVQVAGGKPSAPEPVGMPPGTRIEVRDLFFNTPARLKYLKSVQTEQSRCLDVIHRAALARPDVGFRCAIDDHVVFQTTGNGSVRDVLAALYSVGEAKQFLPVTADTADYRLHGWIGRPTQAKSSRSHTYLYINQRPIRNPAVHQAVVAGYGNRLMVGKHPMYALYLEMDPGLVDVNIHPHKAEVRFSEERDVVQMVQRAVQSVLDTTFLVPGVSFSGTPASDRRVVSGQQAKLELATTAEPAAPYQPGTGYPTSAGSRVLTASPGKREGSVPTVSRTPKQPVDWQQWMPLQSSPPEPSHTDVPVADEPAAPDADRAAEERPSNWRLRPVGQALGMYMIAEDGQDLYVIDQHAAHERVLYERFSQRMRAAEVPAIALVTPLNLTLSGAQWDAVQTHRELLAEMGLSLEAFGGRDVVVRTIPTIWEGLDYGQLVEEFLETLAASARLSNVRDVLRDQIVMRACKAAIKANDFLHPLEMEALCEALSTLEDPFHCPHGRPVFLRLTAQQLEKEFRRIV